MFKLITATIFLDAHLYQTGHAKNLLESY